MTAEDIRAALRKRYVDHRQYAVAEEVGITTGGGCRRLDMVVINCFESNCFRIDGIEIKISTSDLRRELEFPEKHVAFYNVIDYYTLAVPAGVVEPLMDIIPKRWGIMIVDTEGNTRYKRKPLALEDKKSDGAISRGFFASFVRSIQTRQPSDIELMSAYQKGLQEGKESQKRYRDYQLEEIKRNAGKIEAYDKLQRRFFLWGEDVETVLDDFERFRKINPDRVLGSIDKTIEHLTKLKGYLHGVEEES